MSNLENRKQTPLEAFAEGVKSGEISPNAHGVLKCKGYEVKCDIYPDVKIDGDNGLVKGTISFREMQAGCLSEILGHGSHNLDGQFHDISHIPHTYVEYAEDIDNTLYVTADGKEFQFHKVYLKRKGSLSDFFVFIAQMTIGDIEELTEVFNPTPRLE